MQWYWYIYSIHSEVHWTWIECLQFPSKIVARNLLPIVLQLISKSQLTFFFWRWGFGGMLFEHWMTFTWICLLDEPLGKWHLNIRANVYNSYDLIASINRQTPHIKTNSSLLHSVDCHLDPTVNSQTLCTNQASAPRKMIQTNMKRHFLETLRIQWAPEKCSFRYFQFTNW